MGAESVLASLGYMPTRDAVSPVREELRLKEEELKLRQQAQQQAQQQGILLSQQEELRKQKEQEAKKMKDQMDFYKTVREYLSPSQAYKVMKENYPDFNEEFANAPEKTDTSDLYKLAQTRKVQAETEAMLEEQKVNLDYKKALTKKALEGGGEKQLTAEQSRKADIAKKQIIQYIKQRKAGGMNAEDISSEFTDPYIKNPLQNYFDPSDPNIQSALGGEEVDSEQERLITDNMKAYGKSREEVTAALKKKGLI